MRSRALAAGIVALSLGTALPAVAADETRVDYTRNGTDGQPCEEVHVLTITFHPDGSVKSVDGPSYSSDGRDECRLKANE